MKRPQDGIIQIFVAPAPLFCKIILFFSDSTYCIAKTGLAAEKT